MKQKLFRFTLISFLLGIFITGCSTNNNSTDVLELAIDGLGGHEALDNLNAYSIKSERDEYIMGQGPETGHGLMRLAAPDVTVSHDLDGETVRIDVVTNLAARAGGYIKRESTSLLVGNAGYLSEDDLFGIVPERDKPLSSDKTAAAKKTERLLNPHILLKELMAQPDLLTNQPEGISTKGYQYSAEEVFPVTIDRVRQTGRRTLIATQEWLKGSQGSTFHELMAEKIEIDPDWFKRWQESTNIDEGEHLRLTIKDEVYPITLFISPESGRITKLKTMEWDVIYGDIELEVIFDQWQRIDGIDFPMLVKISQGGAPRLEVRRSLIEVNPSQDPDYFNPPPSVVYKHNQAAATRGKYLSQTIRMFTLAGAARPELGSIELEPGVDLLYALPVDGIYTMVVEQEKGVVVIEPGMNDLKGEEIIRWIGERYPGKPVTHLIVSHHHNDHGGGIRPYVANGTTLVVHNTATDFYQGQVNRPKSTVLMDALDRNPRSANIIGVVEGESYTIEDPTQSVTVYPVLGGHTEDMVVAVLEKQSMLYAGDLYVSGIARDLRSGTKRGPNVLPFHSAVALDETIRAYNLDVPILVGSHDRQPVTYQDLVNYISD